jgi:predicted RNA-binding protein
MKLNELYNFLYTEAISKKDIMLPAVVSEKEKQDAFKKLSAIEIKQLGTGNVITSELWPRFRKYMVTKSLHTNPKTNPELCAYTPGETLNLFNHPIINEYHNSIITHKIPSKYDTVIFVPCAKTKPWKNATKGQCYPSYNKILKEYKNVYFVTISEPLGIVPQDMWEDFPQYDNPGLFKDPVMRSDMFTADWKRLFNVNHRLTTPFDKNAYKECINILGNVIKRFVNNNPNFRYISFVEDFKGKGTHSEMLDMADIISPIVRYLKRANPREQPYEYIKSKLQNL